MVRIQCRVSRKRYLGSKQVYEYERMSLHIPRRFHNKVKCMHAVPTNELKRRTDIKDKNNGS